MTIETIRANSLFILGVQKAGTTSLHDLLAQHPEIAAASPKEPNHYIKTGADWPMVLANGATAMSELPYVSDEDYAAIFAPDEATHYYLDSSTGYFPYDEALDTIAAQCKDARIIVVLREPVSRAYSAFNWARKVGWEPIESFEQALDAEPARRAENYWFSYWYATHGLYADRIAAVRKRFPEARFILFDDIRSDAAAVCTDIFDWLGLPPAEVQQLKSNPSGLDRGRLRRKLRSLVTMRRSEQGVLAGLVRAIVPAGLLRMVKRRITGKLDSEVVAPERLDPALKAKLAAQFAEDIVRTEKLLGRDLSAWKQR